MTKVKNWMIMFASVYALNIDAGMSWYSAARLAFRTATNMLRRMQTPGE